MGKRVASGRSWIGSKDGGEKFGSSRTDDGRLAKFDINIGDALFMKNIATFEGCGVGLFAAEGLGLDPDPKN